MKISIFDEIIPDHYEGDDIAITIAYKKSMIKEKQELTSKIVEQIQDTINRLSGQDR